jgi:hypothetical protein
MRCRCRLNGRRSYRASYAPNCRSRSFGRSRCRRFARQEGCRSHSDSCSTLQCRPSLGPRRCQCRPDCHPGFLHGDMLLQVRERDLPILCEKPLTPDAQSSWEVLEAEQRLGKKRIQVGFMRRFDTEYHRLRAIITSGELGELLMLHCSHRVPEVPQSFTNEMLINDAVVHEFDVIRYLTGEEIKNVQVRLGRASRHSRGTCCRKRTRDSW